MAVVGAGYCVVYPALVLLGAGGWVWGEPHRLTSFEYMLYAIYGTLGVFLIWGARNPIRYRPLIDYTIVSNLLHATAMLYFAVTDHREHEHLGVTGDVVGTYAAPLILLAGHPAFGIAQLRHRRSSDTQ
ncbi:BphX family protein [Streptomyces sp. NPDC047108]|uniref:BphX family protein n=1 Tax=Streptomyces sp. NPDC047108 TaxID=3155025 RepID=UPI0033E47B57